MKGLGLALTLLYLPPLLKICCEIIRPFLFVPLKSRWKQGLRLSGEKINRCIGLYEYYLRPIRNYTVGPALFVFFVVLGVKVLSGKSPVEPAALPLSLSVFFLLVTYYSIQLDVKISLKMAEFLRGNPRLHPQPFFDAIYKFLGPFPYTLPDSASLPTITPDYVSFKRDNRSRQSYFLLLPIVWDTARLAHICLKCLKYVGPEYTCEVFDPMAILWGKRILQWISGQLTVTGGEQLGNLDGKILLIPNHKSQLDFILTFFALSEIRLKNGRKLKPRFITAKDHFLDNFFVYEMLGVGKLIEAVDMVFIERRRSRKGIQDLSKAAEFLAEKEIDIAIFPQGTRALPNHDRSGKRRDAGYYTTIPAKDISADLGHLRKGTAYLSTDTLIELSKKDPSQKLHLVFVAIKGTAVTLPRHSLKIQTEAEIHYHIGEPLTLTTRLSQGMRRPERMPPETEEESRYLELVGSLHREIDGRLSAILAIHENLKHRFLVDLQGHFRFSQERIHTIEAGLDQISRQSPIVYQILDRIYASHPSRLNPCLSELAQLLLDGSVLERFKILRDEVTLTMLQSTRTKLHGRKIKHELSKNSPGEGL